MSGALGLAAAGGQIAGDIGSATSALFGAIGAYKSVGAYKQAEGYALQNEEYEEADTLLKVQQQQRQLELTVGAQKAGVAAAGFKESGTALNLLNYSTQQGALAKAALQTQGAITEAGYQEQADQLHAAAQAANLKGFAGIVGGVLSAGAAIGTGILAFG